MIDPILSLAISLHRNKGVYALLLGSGISRSSGIPTGWEIVQDLIRQISHLRGETCEPDPDVWFRRTFESEPEYSDVLDQLTGTPAERSQLLRVFFEPTEDELGEGRKRPTAAHRAIAALVAKGYVRVIVTTNFDRLLEHALTEIGIQPVVISTGDAAHGALPLAHSPCSIIKINGDYLDTRLRNTRGELARYDDSLEKLLDQVFDEYGVIVAGWSADWDKALCSAIERCPTRRFTTYWAQRGPVGPRAATLITLRRATTVPIVDADSFFDELNEKIVALESFAASDSLSADVAVARLKKYLSTDRYKINLSDLLSAETERVFSAVADERFPLHSVTKPQLGASLLQRLKAYEADLSMLLPMLVCGAFWAVPEQYFPFVKSFKRLADERDSTAGGISIWLKLRHYPALLVLYGMGLGALANSNYRFLKALFDQNIRVDRYKPEQPAVTTLHNLGVLEKQEQQLLPGRRHEHTPLSNHLFDCLREPLRAYLPDDIAYEATFDWFEYLVCLAYCDLKTSRRKLEEAKNKDPNFTIWSPIGRFSWKIIERDILRDTASQEDGTVPPNVAAALQAGFCESGDGTRTDKYIAVSSALRRSIEEIRHFWGIY